MIGRHGTHAPLALHLMLAVGVLGTAGCGSDRELLDESSAPLTATTLRQNDESGQAAMRVRFTIGSGEATATLRDDATARDFASLLPLTITMGDHFGREKPGQLPRELAPGGTRQFTYNVGDVAYWAPSYDLALFYSDDGQWIPNPGLVVLGQSIRAWR